MSKLLLLRALATIPEACEVENDEEYKGEEVEDLNDDDVETTRHMHKR